MNPVPTGSSSTLPVRPACLIPVIGMAVASSTVCLRMVTVVTGLPKCRLYLQVSSRVKCQYKDPTWIKNGVFAFSLTCGCFSCILGASHLHSAPLPSSAFTRATSAPTPLPLFQNVWFVAKEPLAFDTDWEREPAFLTT